MRPYCFCCLFGNGDTCKTVTATEKQTLLLRICTYIPIYSLCVYFPYLALLLGSLRMDFADIRKLVLSVDDEKLHEQTIEQLIKYMPNKDEMMQLLAYKDKMNDLNDAERFGVVVRTLSSRNCLGVPGTLTNLGPVNIQSVGLELQWGTVAFSLTVAIK